VTQPRRLVSLVPSLTETLASWGLADRIVGVTDWCVSPELPGVVRVRGTKNPDIARIIELAPDLVVANEEENRKVDVERLRAAGLAVHVTSPRSLDEVVVCFEGLGELLGVEEPAAHLVAEITAALDGEAPDPLRTFCPVWRDPWIAVGTDTIAADLLRRCGFDVVPEVPRYPRVELDDIARLDPDVVLLPDEPYEFGPVDMVDFAGWRAEVRLIDGAALTWWGPRTAQAVRRFRTLAGDLAGG
jgi:ABC-type Fe3+-hydroxamate transport system substrate-binding protein